MNEKRLIELAQPDYAQQTTRAYFGVTLASVLGDSNPSKEIIRSLECTRLTPTCSRQRSTTSAHSKTTVSDSTHRFLSVTPRRAVSAGSRVVSAVSTSDVSTSDRTSSIESKVYSVPGNKTQDSTHLRWCRSGLTVWTVQNEVLQEVDINDHGFFHQSNCYMVFQTDYDILMDYAAELDRHLGGVSFLSLEHEGHETGSFLRHFQDGIIVTVGKSKHDSQKAPKNVKRLYKVVGRSYLSATCTNCSGKFATENDIFILDGYPRMYVWLGQKTDFVLRVKAIRLAKKIRSRQQNGKSVIVVVEQTDKQMSDALLKKLNSDEQCEPDDGDSVVAEVKYYKPSLYKVNGERVLYDMPLVAERPLKQKYLTSQDSFLLDKGPSGPLHIWVGGGTGIDALYNALHFAKNFRQHHNYPEYTAVCRVREGHETTGFRRTFVDWKSRLKKNGIAGKSYPVANTDKSSHGMDDSSHDDLFQTENGTIEIWKISGETLDSVPEQQQGVFYNHHCYIIVKRESRPEDQIVIYFWVGSKTNSTEQDQAKKIALAMNSLLDHEATIIRVLDGKEPSHFFKTIQGSLIVYDDCLVQDNMTACKLCINNNNTEFSNNTQMFCVHERQSESMRVSQVSPVSTSLNSAAVYVIISCQTSMLWFGKKSSAHERECSKYLFAYFCPERLHDFDIIIEGREPATFWSLVQYNGDHPTHLSEFKLPRHFPTLSLCSRKLAVWFYTDFLDFSKEDLCETDIFILDTHDQIHLWIGSCFMDRNNEETLSSVIQSYVDLDPAGRNNSDLQMLLCYQGYEPAIFRKHFRLWSCQEYGGEVAYERARSQLRRENAVINHECQYRLPDK